jgi:hypothetical protein
LITCFSLCTAIDVTVANKGVVFVKGPAVAFSESTWTLVTELNTKRAHDVANNLTAWLSQSIGIDTNPPNQFAGIVHRKANRSLKILQQRVSVVNDKLSAVDLIIKDASRTRRAIIDGGGKLLDGYLEQLPTKT